MLTMPSCSAHCSAQRLVRIAVSVMLPHHRSLLGSCPLAGGLCLGAHMISRRRLQTPRAAADGTERPAALRYASARWYSARGARPGGLCAPAAARRGAQRSPRIDLGTLGHLLPGQGHNASLRRSKHSIMSAWAAHKRMRRARSDSARGGTPRGAVRTRGAAHC